MNKAWLVPIALAACVALPSYAADAAASAPHGDGACKADIEKLCPNVQPGEGRIKACMKEHRKELSKECKQDLMKARKARKGGEE